METLRAIALRIKETDRLEDAFRASELVEIAEEDLGLHIEGANDDARNQAFGRKCSSLFRNSHSITLDEITITREEQEVHADGKKRSVKFYRFT